MAAGPLQDALQAVLTDAHNDALETNANVGDAMRAALGRVAAMVEAAAEKADLAHESSESYDRLLRQYGPDIVDFGGEAYIARCEQGEDWDVAVRLRVTAALPQHNASPPHTRSSRPQDELYEAAQKADEGSERRAAERGTANRAVAAPASALPMTAREQTSAIFLEEEAPPSPRLHRRAPQQCAVCLHPVGDSHPCKGPRTKLSGCGHAVCKDCITPALAPPNHARCPTCRADVAWIEFSSGYQLERVAPRELPDGRPRDSRAPCKRRSLPSCAVRRPIRGPAV